MIGFVNPRWADVERTLVRAEAADGGGTAIIPASAANADFAAIVEAGVETAPFRRWSALAEAKSALIADVKVEAERRILAILPEWKQRNATAHGLALVRKVQLGGTLDADDRAAEAAYAAAWDAISAIRTASDAKEAEIAGLPDLDGAEAYDVGAGWPD